MRILHQSISLLGFITAFASAAALPADTESTTSTSQQSFDYVIVGGGIAGLVLANRLSETRGTTVAVIEAGTFIEDVVGNSSEVPAYAGRFNGATPQELDNRTFPYWRAKALGGCSAINYMAYGQTSKGAHQLWADTLKDQSYTYSNMLPYYRKTMNFSAPNLETRFANTTPTYPSSALSMTSGQLGVTYASYAQSWSTWFARGFEAIGVPRVSAYINGNLLGQTWQLNTITQSNGHRSSSDTAYLRPVLGRKNLVVFRNTFAERVIFRGKTATGVQVTTESSKTQTISAKKEVILSAGVFQSPQLLQVSGVGPKDLLEKYRIPVVADRPGVGRNFHDHVTIPISYKVNVLTSTALENPAYLANAVSEFNAHGTGPLSSAGGDYHAMEKIPKEMRSAFSRSTLRALEKLPTDWPEVSYAVYPSAVTPPEPGANYGSMLGTMTAPQSRGSVTITSANMRDAPLIDGNYLSDNTDTELMVAIFKRLRQALTSSAIAPALIGQEVFPGASVQTDAQILDYLKRMGNPLFHAFASNKMGLASDPDAVVDNRGRVFGVNNLRVIDSSSFPFLPPGPAPQIQVYTLAEKLADDIKKGRN